MRFLKLHGGASFDGSGFVIRDGLWRGRILLGSDDSDVPSNYLICDRSGFKAKRSEGLRQQWDGHMVLDEFFEHRHPQDRLPPAHDDGGPGAKNPEPIGDETYLEVNDITSDSF